jgi:hypothetical protein
LDSNGEKQTSSKIHIKQMKQAETKTSLWEKAHHIGPVVELVPGFSFDSDSKIRLYD